MIFVDFTLTVNIEPGLSNGPGDPTRIPEFTNSQPGNRPETWKTGPGKTLLFAEPCIDYHRCLPEIIIFSSWIWV